MGEEEDFVGRLCRKAIKKVVWQGYLRRLCREAVRLKAVMDTGGIVEECSKRYLLSEIISYCSHPPPPLIFAIYE